MNRVEKPLPSPEKKTNNLAKAVKEYFLDFSPGSEGQYVQFQMSSGVDVNVDYDSKS